jgi:hypothetical protein
MAQSVLVHGERLWLAPHLCATFPARVLQEPVLSLRGVSSQVVDAPDAVISRV